MWSNKKVFPSDDNINTGSTTVEDTQLEGNNTLTAIPPNNNNTINVIVKQSTLALEVDILINNEVHESVGGQTTSARFINIPEIVKASGYSNVLSIDKTFNIAHQCQKLIKSKGPNFLEIKVKPGSREDLGRPTIDPVDNKINFMKFVSKK